MAIERQELYCHDCGNYVQFDIDMSLNGNHVLTCPVCGHEHCRVVYNGHITDIRWDSRNIQKGVQYYNVSNVTISQSSTFSLYTSTTATATITNAPNLGTTAPGLDMSTRLILYSSWMNTIKV